MRLKSRKGLPMVLENNLPPGCQESDIPGCRPQDKEWDLLWDWLDRTGLEPEQIKEAVKDYIAEEETKRVRS